MQKINIRNFFLLSLSVTLLFMCCAGSFYVWKFEKDKALNEKIQQEKRKKMDEAYTDEFTSIWVFSYENKYSASSILEEFNQAETAMRMDGYNFSEIKEIRHKGWVNAQKELKRS